jgi:hypothetical protein
MTDRSIIEVPSAAAEGSELRISNLSGRLVYSRIIGQEPRIEVFKDEFPQGFYLVELMGVRTYRSKLIIE